jgi:AraC-like DNA-binding protein
MSIYRHRPQPALRPFIDWLWYYVDYYPDHDRQHVLPDGTFELMINLQDIPRKLFDREANGRFTSFKRGWISGAHTSYLIIDALPCSSMIGAHLKPGGAAAFLGIPAGEVCDQVVELDAIWGDSIWEWREQLLQAQGPSAKLRVMEDLLLNKVVRQRANPAVMWALDHFVQEPHMQSMAQVSGRLGISHKHFIDQFTRHVGLTPKKFCRIRRFQQVLGQIQSTSTVDWTDIACACGYYDQPHFINDFAAFSGVNPSRYLAHRLEGDTKFIRAVT